MSTSVAMIVSGTVLIAIGGVVATLGWNGHADDKRHVVIADATYLPITGASGLKCDV